MFTADAPTGSTGAAEERAAPVPGGDVVFTGRFERWYAPLVGLARRIVDPTATTPASLDLSEQIVVERCLDEMVGHPGTVPLHYEILGPDIDFDGELPVAELHGALTGMRRRDRRVGVLALAAGFSPTQVATLLQRPLDETIDRVARVCTRLADGRRIGLTDDVQVGVE